MKMKKLLVLFAVVLALMFTVNPDARAQTKLQTGVPMLIASSDSVIIDTILEAFYSKIDVTYSIQIITSEQSGTGDGLFIRQYSNDGVNFVNIDTLTLSDGTDANDITTFVGTTWPAHQVRIRYDEVSAAGMDYDILIFALPNKD